MIVDTVKPALAYTRTMRRRRAPRLEAVRGDGACLMVIRLMLRDAETGNGIELTNMTPTTNVTCL